MKESVMGRLEYQLKVRCVPPQARNSAEAVLFLAQIVRERRRLEQERSTLLQRIGRINLRLDEIGTTETKIVPAIKVVPEPNASLAESNAPLLEAKAPRAERERDSAKPKAAERERDSAKPKAAERERDSAKPKAKVAVISSGMERQHTLPTGFTEFTLQYCGQDSSFKEEMSKWPQPVIICMDLLKHVCSRSRACAGWPTRRFVSWAFAMLLRS